VLPFLVFEEHYSVKDQICFKVWSKIYMRRENDWLIQLKSKMGNTESPKEISSEFESDANVRGTNISLISEQNRWRNRSWDCSARKKRLMSNK
jgi:hypothetical protein